MKTKIGYIVVDAILAILFVLYMTRDLGLGEIVNASAVFAFTVLFINSGMALVQACREGIK